MVTYDAGILQKYAEDLYTKALNMVAAYFCLGAIAGALAGAAWMKLAKTDTPLWLMLGLIVGLIAGKIGHSKSFALKLEAQRALCQMRIEENTRCLTGLISGMALHQEESSRSKQCPETPVST